MENKLRILLVSWEKVFWEGLIKILNNCPDITIVGLCINGKDGIQKAIELKPDVVLIDEGIKNCECVEVSKRIRLALPRAYIGIMTAVSPYSDSTNILRAEANLYLDKDVTTSAMIQLIDRWKENTRFDERGVFLSPAMAELLVKKLDRSRFVASEDIKENLVGLTRREMEIAALIVKNKSNKEIAKSLYISENTVKAHLSSIYEKLHLRTRHQIVSLMEGHSNSVSE